MAQVVGGTTYDFEWDRTHDAALEFLARTADRCAGVGTAKVAIDQVVAIILHIFGERYLNYTRSPQYWARVAQDLPEELCRLKPELKPSEVEDVARQLQAEAKSAAEGWALGDPENPPTSDLLNVLEHILFHHRITRNPPKHPTPTSLRE
jgi:hypothetical protein